MKTILIATDFSDAANNAAIYGVELADTLNAKVILFSACHQIPVLVEAPAVITWQEIEQEVQQQLTNEARTLSARHNTPVTTCCKTGAAARAILEAVKENKVDLVITGMKKSGKQYRRIMGSTVTELIGKMQVPMLVVPEDVRYSYIANIALANESDIAPDTDRHILYALRRIAERFHSKLYLVRVAKNRFAEAYEMMRRPFQLSRMMYTLDPIFTCIEGKDVTQALTEFVDQYNIQMLAVLPHKYSMFQRWFLKSTSRALAFESEVPLLILPYNQGRYAEEEEIQFN